ncbi:MAG: SOS response-associated peptidase [Candidatus Rifleibacteriota bacterium]
MCGRFTLTGGLNRILKILGLQHLTRFAPRFNIAPGQPVLCFYSDIDTGQYAHDHYLWGLIPSFVKEPSAGKSPINARAETVAIKPSFNNAFKYRRCIIPATGFYEWESRGKEKQPWYFTGKENAPFYFAGLWEVWHGPDGEQLNTCAIITTASNQRIRHIHHRMPLILPEEKIIPWLNRDTDLAELKNFLVNPDEVSVEFWPANKIVNSPANDGPECIEQSDAYQPDLF